MGNGEFRGAVPLESGRAPTITCPWHQTGETHPPDAPACRYEAHLGQHVVEMAGLIFWSAVKVQRLAIGVAGMAQHLVAIQTQLEALEASLTGFEPE